MKQISLLNFVTMLTLSTLASVAFAGGNGSGGGNTLGGRMIESYIASPRAAKDYDGLRQRLHIVGQKSPDLFYVVAEGLNHATWYFIPTSLREISAQITGIPFESNQTAIQVYRNEQVWVDMNGYASLVSAKERQTLLLHEALLAGVNSFATRVWNDNLERLFLRVPVQGMDGQTMRVITDEAVFTPAIIRTLPDVQELVRKTTALIMSDKFAAMNPKEVQDKLADFGWIVRENGRVVCAMTSGFWGEKHNCGDIPATFGRTIRW